LPRHNQNTHHFSSVMLSRPQGIPGLLLLANEAGGDCQFLALAQSLNQYSGLELPRLRERLAAFGVEAGKVTGADLRVLAFVGFLAPLPELDAHLRQWKEWSQDPSMEGTFNHGRYLTKRVGAMTADDRHGFLSVLMDRLTTWGDETSLMVLERLLRLRVDVLTGRYLQARDHSRGDCEEPLVFTCMNLSAQHYEAVVAEVGGLGAWARTELPEVLVHLHRTHCASSDHAYLRMSPEWLEGSASSCMEREAPVDPIVPHVLACLRLLEARPVEARKPPQAAQEEAVEALGGWQYAGYQHSHVSRLQCGLPVQSPEAPAVEEESIPRGPRWPGAAPIRFWP